MLTRRSVRIKTMQAVFAANFNGEVQIHKIINNLKNDFSKVYHLYYYLLYQMLQIALIAESEKERRQGKHITTEEDLNFDDKISRLNFVQSLQSNKVFQSYIKEFKLDIQSDDDKAWIKKIFQNMLKSKFYNDFLSNQNIQPTDESRLFYKLLQKSILENDDYSEHLEELFTNLEDDKKVVVFSVKSLLENYVQNGAIDLPNTDKDEEEIEFGENLLKISIEKSEDLKDIIVPKLVRWDWDRIALIDSILLKMAVAELLYFPTIPVKVTINEYIDIAKLYSTPKSKDFINGLLDRIMNSLKSENKIVKTGRGLQG